MRVTLSQLVVMMVLTGISKAEVGMAQGALERDISLNVDNESLVTTLNQIEQKVSVRFVYSKNFVRLDQRVSITAHNEKLATVLDKLLAPLEINYEAINDRIVLRKTRSHATPQGRSSESRDQSHATIETLDLRVTGTVSADNGEKLPGVNVLVKGTTNGTVTDSDGRYALTVTDGTETLVFSFIGYITQEVAVNNRSVVDVELTADVQALEEVVVVGYGEQKKVTVTGSVVAVAGTELQKSPAVDLSNSFAGRLAGVVAVQTSGEPGYDGSTIRIRGVNSIGNTSPLIVIDGIPDREGGLGRLSPQDVESISVLKDASAAIYGSRAANGVILITTKRGKSGKPKITYDFNQGFSQPTRLPPMSNAVEYGSIMNEIPIYQPVPSGEWTAAWQAIQQTGTYDSPTPDVQTVNANYSPTDMQLYRDGTDPWGHPDTDWFGDAMKTWSPQNRHNLQVSGGTDNVNYLASLGYVYQDAYYKNSATYYEQYNLRTNLDVKISKYINTNLGLMLRQEERNFPTQSAGSIFRMLMRGRPTEPEVWPNGLPGPDIENGQNPYVITTSATGYDYNPKSFIQTNAAVEFTNPWIKGLKLTLSGAVDRTVDKRKRWETPWYLYTWDKVSYESDGVTPQLDKVLRSTFSDARLTQSYGNVLNSNLTALMNYDRSFGSHNLGLLVGVTREQFSGDFIEAYRREYISTAIDQPFAGGGTQLIRGGNDNRNTYSRARLGYYGRVTYNFEEKYLAEFLWRYDGSSLFPESNRFGFFPGILLGWNISNEDFFSSVGFFDFLKLRASYGQMGNDQIYDPEYLDIDEQRLVEYAFLSSYIFDSYPINNQVATTLYEGKVANPNYTWEVSNNSNVGIEGTVLGNKIDFTLEYFYNRREQMLIFKTGSTPFSSGIADRLPPVNAGVMENKGYDFTIGYSGEISALKFRVGVNAGKNKNKVIFMDEPTGAPDYQWQTGHVWEAYLVYKSDGVFLNEEEIANETLDYSGVSGSLKPGDMKYVDVSGDGIIDADDMVRLDKSITPNFNYGITLNFEYRNFDLSILFQGASGALLRFGTESGDIGNYLKYSYDNRWSIDNPSSVHPRLAIRNDTYYTNTSTASSFGNNTYYLFKKDYLRLKNVELGYNFPMGIIDGVGLSNARIYVNGLNLITWDKYGIFDPETDNGGFQYYPQARVITAGVRLTF